MTIEKQFIEALEPLIDEIAEVKQQINAVSTIKGDDGIGIDAPIWQPEVYRAGSIVQHNVGQYFKAVKDTAANPNDSDEWERIGSAGFRFTKAFDADAVYRNGDLFIKDFGLFGMFGGEVRCIVGRGAKGEKGLTGQAGKDGQNGKDGSEVIGFESEGLSAALVVKSSSGELSTYSIDFNDVIKSQLDKLREHFEELSYDEVVDVVEKSLTVHEIDTGATPLRFFRGTWSINDNYSAGDLVSFNGKLYVAKSSNASEMPTGGSITNPLAGSEFWRYIPLSVGSVNQSGGGGGNFLPLTGGTMTGALILKGAPTVNLEAATKAYVDSSIANIPAPVMTGYKLFTRSQWNRTLTQDVAIANNTAINLFNGTTALREADKIAAGTDSYDPYTIVTNKIVVPWAGVVLHHSIRVNFTFATGGTETATVILRRASDNTIIGAPIICQRNSDDANNQVIFNTYSSSATDPFVTGGFYIEIRNQSGNAVTLAQNSQIGVYIATSYASPRTF